MDGWWPPRLEMGDHSSLGEEDGETAVTVMTELHQIEQGRPIERRSRYGESRSVVIDRVWEVWIDGVLAGFTRYVLITRERGSKHNRYVTSRWQSPGWQWRSVDGGGWFESVPSSRAECVRRIEREWARR